MSSSDAPKKEKMGIRHIMFVVTCCVMMATCTGMWFNAAGIFYNTVSADMGVGLGQFSLYITLSYVATTVFLPFAGRMLERFEARTLYSIGTILMFASFVIMAAAQNIWMFYIAGVLSAGMVAFNLYLLPVLIGRWFKARVGFVVGLSSAFSGIGAALWNPMGTAIMTAMGWRAAYLTFGIITLVALLPLVFFFVRSTPEEVGIKPYGIALSAGSATTQAGTEKLTGADYGKVMKSPAFILFCLMGVCGPLIAMINMYLPSYAQTIGFAAMIGATMASASMIGNLIGKIAFGAVSDKSTTAAVLCGAAAPLIGIVIMMSLGATSEIFVLAASFIFGMCNGNAVVILPLVVRRSIGDKDYARVWANISPICALFAGVGATLWGFVFDATKSYDTVFIIGIVLCILLVLFYFGAIKFAKRIPHTSEVVDAKGHPMSEAANA